MNLKLQYSSLALFLLLIISCQNRNLVKADLIVKNAVIWTGNEKQPNANAMAVKADSILAIGSYQEIEKLIGSETEVYDVKGAFITPGFIDTHVHFISGGFGLSSVQLRDAATPEEFADRIKIFSESLDKDIWITEGNWDHEMWGGELPRRDWIDEFTSDNPVFVMRLDGHMGLANSAALKYSGLDDKVKDVKGGTIVRDDNGRLTGILKDNAMGLVLSKMPEPTSDQYDAAIIAGMNYVASKGVTTVHNMDQTSVKYIDKFRTINQKGSQITRFYIAVGLSRWNELAESIRTNGEGDEWIKLGVLKGMIDGSLGSHTAAFFEPFTDAPEDKGFFVMNEDSLYSWVNNADKAGLQLAIHAIGDRSINTLLNVFEKVGEENGPRDRRFRIEHAQHISPEDIARFSKLGVIASMQPYHAIDDGRWAEKIIGPERIKTTYAFKSLLDAKATLAFGSDWFVAPATPLEGIYAAVTRRTLDEKNDDGWVPEQKISVEDALKAYTINGAYASFEEEVKGSLEPGKLADFVVLDKNLFEIDPIGIKDVSVIKTFVGGLEVYSISN